MSLSTALNIAQSSLFNLSRQTSVVSNNISNAGNENYVRRSAALESMNPGVRFVSVRRHAAVELFRSSIQSSANFEAQNTLHSHINGLKSSIIGANGELSVSSHLTAFHNALQVYSASPSDGLLGEAAVNSAKDLVRRLNDAANAIQSTRTSVDAEIDANVDRLNSLLSDFYEANKEVTKGTIAGTDVSNALDRRDTLIKEISKIVPVSTIQRANNDLVLMSNGATLFETTPRNVTFTPQSAYGPSTVGNLVRIDGIPVDAGTGANTTAKGSLAALLQVRDTVTTDLQSQLDEVARGLIDTFAERDPSGGGLPALAGLFTYPGGPGLPPSGTIVQGLAQTISVNSLFDPAQGGDPALLRDGGTNGAGYIENSSGGASFADRLIRYNEALDAPLAFDPASGIGGSKSLVAFAADSLGWLEGYRASANEAAITKQALAVQLNEALISESGVNLDVEMSRLLDLENTFEASARLIRAVDQMLQDLLAAVR